MHLVDIDAGVMATSAIVATTIPLAVGYAYASAWRNHAPDYEISTCFFGDRATEEGVFYESVNFAVLHKLPVLFVCENNGLAVNAPLRDRQASTPTERALGMGVRHHAFIDRLHGGIVEVHETTCVLMDAILLGGGDGPAFLEIEVERIHEHVGPRRTISESEIRQRDSLNHLEGALSQEIIDSVRDGVESEIDVAFLFAEQSPPPSPIDAYRLGVRS